MEWISVKDDLPLDGQRVFVTVITKEGRLVEDCFFVDRDIVQNGKMEHIRVFQDVIEGYDEYPECNYTVEYKIGEEVTHWAPFPEPAKEN